MSAHTVLFLICLLLAHPSPGLAQSEHQPPDEAPASSDPLPLPPKPPHKWRIIYIEGGAFKDYYLTLVGLAHGLEKLGLIANGQVPFDEKLEDSSPLWQWLAAEAGGDYLEFLADGYYSADWDDARRLEIKEQVLKRLREKKDVDLIWASGTSASRDMTAPGINAFVMSNNVTDPVAAGVSRTKTDSGRDNVHVQVEADRQERQLRIFYDLFKFKRLGVPMDSSESGRKSLGADIIEKMAEEMDFELIPCVADLDIADQDRSFNNLMGCLEKITTESDAVFLTFNNGMQAERMDEILAPIIRHRRPSFSQLGPGETSLGVLMSLGQDNYEAAGDFEAAVIHSLLSGRKPREISQIFNSPLTLAVNLAMAKAIGWEPPFDLLVTVDEIYQNLAQPPRPGSGAIVPSP